MMTKNIIKTRDDILPPYRKWKPFTDDAFVRVQFASGETTTGFVRDFNWDVQVEWGEMTKNTIIQAEQVR